MTGFTYGQADDAVEGIVWTESILGRGYDLLRMADERRQRAGWPKHAIEVGPATATAWLPGLPAYGFAARLADLAIELAMSPSAERAASVKACGAFGGWIVPYIAYRIARAQQHAAVLWRPSSPVIAGEVPTMLIVAEPAQDSGMPPFTILPAGLFANVGCRTNHEATVSSFLLKAILDANDNTSGASLIAIAATSASVSREAIDASAIREVFGKLDLQGESGLLDTAERLQSAVSSGMDVPSEKHAFLNALSQRIRMPNTERSKSQAG